jgi:hypothetical protein
MMKKALLIIDVQKSAVVKPEIAKNIEKLQYEYDVVFVSKGDGLIWMKRKHYFKPELNNQFFANYYNDSQEDE